MNRKALYAISLIVIIVFFAVIGMSSWLLGTSQGASWLIRIISNRAGVKTEFRKIEGRLWDSITLEGIQVRWDNGNAKVENLFLEWHPLMILTGAVGINKLIVSKAVLQDNRPDEKKPLNLSWPKISGLPGRVDAWIDELEIREFDYYRLEETHIRVDSLSSLVQWHEATIGVQNLVFATPAIHISGNLEAGFLYPSLKADLVGSLEEPFQDIERFSLKAKLLPRHGDEQLHGLITVNGMTGDKQIAALASKIGVTKTALTITDLDLRQADRQGILKGKGEIDFSNPEPAIDFSFDIEHLDLTPEIKTSTDISGTLLLKGKIEDYSGNFALTNRGNTEYEAALAGSFLGDKETIQLEITEGSLLGGTLKGSIQSSWSAGISFQSDLQARNLNPAIVSTDWNGMVNLNLSMKIDIPDEGNLRAELSGKILESHLRGRELTGEIHASIYEDTIFIKNLFLKGNGFDIYAQGDTGKRLVFHADITDLSGLVPEAEGYFSAKGWLSRKRKLLSGSVNALGNNIVIGRMHIQGITINGHLSENTGSPIHIKADITGLDYEKIRFRKAVLKLQGRPESHNMGISVDFPGSAFRADFTGAYHQGAWNGKILRLSYKDPAGIMDLALSADLSLSKDRLSLSPLIIKGPHGESISLEGKMTMHPRTGFVKSQWHQLNLSRANGWLENAELKGHTAGDLHITWERGKVTNIEMQNTASGAFKARGKTMDIEDSKFLLRWDNHGLTASVHARFSKGGDMKGSITSSSHPDFSVPQEGELDASWDEFSLVMLDPFLPEHTDITGITSGTLTSRWAKRDLLFLSGTANARGTIASDGYQINVKETSLKLDMSGKKIIIQLNLELTNGGSLNGRFVFPTPLQFAVPEQGTVDAQLDGINLSMLQSWLPEGLEVRGILAGQMKGNLMTGGNVDVSGSVSISQGSVVHGKEDRKLSADIRNAGVTWTWSGNVLQGNVSLTLSQYGNVTGHFELPVPARMPPEFKKKETLHFSIDADVQEKGLLTSLFPGLVQESHGSLRIAGGTDGTWENPEFRGTVHLKDAGAYFPAAGITVKDIVLRGYFGKDTIVLDMFTAKSGDGTIDGAATIKMKDWKVSHYKVNITGKGFQTIYLPELQCVTSPELTFEGSSEKLSVRGEIKIPELFVHGTEKSAQVKPSGDVVIIDAIEKPGKELPFTLDIDVHIVLGKKVFVKAEGIDAQLEGDVSLTAKNPDEIYGKGLIQVTKGDFRRYGMNLNIQRGRLIFSGLITRPGLDIVAVRTIGDVKAGVTVSGTPQSPEVKLYSEPSMPDTDILAYIVLGRPLGGNSGESSALLQAAGFLLSQGESVVLQERMKRTFGIDVLDIETGGGELNRSLVTLGKYLTPKLFISYGQSLFGEGSLFRIRYSLSKHWEIETQTGEEMGGDIYYKIDFK